VTDVAVVIHSSNCEKFYVLEGVDSLIGKWDQTPYKIRALYSARLLKPITA